MRKLFLIANAILLALMLFFDICYMLMGGLFLKGIASSMFVLMGVINLIYCIKSKTNLKFPIWMMFALIWAMIGDLLIGVNFYMGAAAFAIGHIFYFVAYCMLKRMNTRDFLYGIMISLVALAIILFVPILDFKSAFMLGVCCAYGLIISFMVGKAVSNTTEEKSYLNKLITIGSIVFLMSDFMLVLKLFGDMPAASYLCLSLYYPAQFLLAFSILAYASKDEVKQNQNTIQEEATNL